MSWYGPNGLKVYCDNGLLAETDECPCCGSGCSQKIVLPSTQKILAIGSHLPAEVPVDTPLYGTFQDCIDATGEMGETSFHVYVEAGTYDENIVTNGRIFVFVGVGVVNYTGGSPTGIAVGNIYFKSMIFTSTYETQIWECTFIMSFALSLDHLNKKIGVKTLTYYMPLIADYKPARMPHLGFSNPGRNVSAWNCRN